MARTAPATKARRKRLSAADHHVQDATELFVCAHMQELAELSGRAQRDKSAGMLSQVKSSLAERGIDWDRLRYDTRHRTYLSNALDAGTQFINDLFSKFPDAKFDFTNVGRQGRLEQRKGDLDLDLDIEGNRSRLSISLKNYEKGPQRIQVCSGTFQSFILNLLLPSGGIGTYVDPTTGTRRTSRAKDFIDWRDAALRRAGYGSVVALIRELDDLNRTTRARVLDSDEFRFYDETKFGQLRRDVGRRGAEITHRILGLLPEELLHSYFVKRIGFDGSEHLLVFGGGFIADSVTDPAFEKLLSAVRCSRLRLSLQDQTVSVQFVNGDDVVLTVAIPHTINSNGAWFRDDEPYEGSRYHPKEKVCLAYGERRPRKSRELATSVNTYVDLGATGILRELRKAAEVAP